MLNTVNLLVLLFLFGKKIKLNLSIDILIIFFPYLKLKEIYKENKYSFIGHPLLNNIVLDNRDRYPIKNIGIFLGSRYQEIINNIPIITQLIKNLEKLKNFKFNFFITKEFEDLIKSSFISEKYQFYLNNREYYDHLSKLDFAFACSGTVHLELNFLI